MEVFENRIKDPNGLTIRLMNDFTDQDYNRFWSKVDLRANNDICWNWLGCKTYDPKKKYGLFVNKKQMYVAHRVAYFLYHKKDPRDMHVLHKCDNHSCVNPNHLFLGTNNDNVQDKVKKGRQARNVNPWNKGRKDLGLWDSPNCKLSELDFVEIKRIYEQGEMTLREISTKYKCSRNTIVLAIRKLGGYVGVSTILKPDDVINIRKEYSPEKRNSVILAKKYNIGNKTIMDIVKRITWRHL